MPISPGALITRIGGALVMQYTTVQSAIERLTDDTPDNDRAATVDLLDVSRAIAVAAVSGLDVDAGRVERLAGHIKGLVDEVWGIVEDAKEEEAVPKYRWVRVGNGRIPLPASFPYIPAVR
jgi:hypothetical protein